MVKQWCCLLLLVLSALAAQANQKYWLFFNDKGDTNQIHAALLSPDAVANRVKFKMATRQWTDFPVCNTYIQLIEKEGIVIVSKSKWLNAVSAVLTDEQLTKVKQFAFVRSVQLIKHSLRIASETPSKQVKQFATAIDMMGGEAFIKAGLNGSKVKVGVIDAGYDNANHDSSLIHLFDRNQVVMVKDFLQPSHDTAFFKPMTKSDFHGTTVLINLAGNAKGPRPIQSGLGTQALFYLARTEDGDHESRKEEDLWIAAMEWMDSLGVRLISTSLGYAREMDNPAENYQIADMNGHTSAISKAATIAVKEKGIFLVVAAGNEGHKEDWKIITTPADVEGVVSVGAVYANWQKAGYSSIGYDSVRFLKPNVATFSLAGTSFSAPAVAGFVACMMQHRPGLSSDSLKSILYQSSHLYPYGNNFIGYGLPQAEVALHLMNGMDKAAMTKPIKVVGESVTFTIDQPEITPIVVFHKKNHQIVAYQEELKITNVRSFWQKLFLMKSKHNVIVIKRQKGILFSTLQVGLTIFEFEW
jgi:subtilisin family serine protease